MPPGDQRKPESKTPADALPEGFRLKAYRNYNPIGEAGANAGFAVGMTIGGGAWAGETVAWAVGTPAGVVVGLQNGDGSVRKVLFGAAGYGELA